MPTLPRSFTRTELGYPREGAIAQYRGPDGLHAHEFGNRWEIHRDYGDPSTLEGVITHAIRDAPEVLLGVLTALAVGKNTFDGRKEISQNPELEAVVAGALAGLVVGGIAYFLTHLDK
jgi:hypothetical protein